VILLDTNALIWLDQSHPRARKLRRRHLRLFVSPATLLELQVLHEVGRIRVRNGDPYSLSIGEHWVLDDPPAATWFAYAADLAWTRDPFDRLIAAHGRLRGWRVATADPVMLEHLGPRGTFEL
jgi:PIN domain nuclease of toxin-antitoxin system